jgi:hypothetical protein
MTYAERAEQIRTLAASLSADEAERDRLKAKADESLARFHRAVREFAESRYEDGEPLAAPETRASRASG